MPSTTYQNFSQICELLLGTVGPPTPQLSGKRDATNIRRVVQIIHGISPFQFHRIHHTILPFPGSLRQVLASPDRELTPQISQSRKIPPALFSMEMWSDRAIKTALSSV